MTAGRIWWVARQDDRRDLRRDRRARRRAVRRPAVVRLHRAARPRRRRCTRTASRRGSITVGGNQAGDRFTEAAAGKALARRPRRTGRSRRRRRDRHRHARQHAGGGRARWTAEDWKTAVIVTDPWHSLRTRSMARSEGIDAVTSPTRQGPAVRTRGTEVRYIARETLAYLYFLVVPPQLRLRARTRYDAVGDARSYDEHARARWVAEPPSAPGAAPSSATGPGCCTPPRCAGWRPRPRWSSRGRATSRGPG